MTAAISHAHECDIAPAVDDVIAPESPAVMTAAEINIAQRRRLTARQQDILDWITSFADVRGFPPTLREIGTAFNIRSTNGVNDHLRALERKGYLKREDMKSRGMVVIGSPVARGSVDPAAVAIDFWKNENRALRELLSRLADACGQAPVVTAQMALLLGDVRSVLRRGVTA